MPIKYTLKELCDLLGVQYNGNGDIIIDHVCGIDRLKSGGLAYLSNPKELSNLTAPEGIFTNKLLGLKKLNPSAECAIIVPQGTLDQNFNLIFCDDPLQLQIEAIGLLYKISPTEEMISPSVVAGVDVRLGENVILHPQVVLYDGVSLGENSIIHSGSVIMEKTVIGKDCLIYPNVTIRENCIIGDRVIIHSGAVIGSDGFGFYQRSGKNRKIPQIGGVIIENDCEIGSCTTIDRARFYDTVIGEGSKLDNLIHIAHNVELGENALVAAQSGVAGSTKIGKRLMMGGQSGIRDNLLIGNQVTLLARTLITSKTKNGEVVAGMPSRPIQQWRDTQARINTLDSLQKKIEKMEQNLVLLKKQIKKQ